MKQRKFMINFPDKSRLNSYHGYWHYELSAGKLVFAFTNFSKSCVL